MCPRLNGSADSLLPAPLLLQQEMQQVQHSLASLRKLASHCGDSGGGGAEDAFKISPLRAFPNNGTASLAPLPQTSHWQIRVGWEEN